ncbi:Na(+)/H(+) antiporter [Diplogelasinospora grovesii]|uniref:Na(+)/H(+) antiporter n=1 Tax=Diplogelasinospora grovesii TaxID=303347 RepID=A0AAN6S3D3_9PEZI|nr:Na(+)/H(+) antiporter [Diplogelasinospora grovesii]
MAWEHLSITKPHLVYIILGGFTSLFMLCSTVIKEKIYIGEATVATVCGIIFGPHAANLINPQSWGSVDIVTIEFSRIVLVVQCFAVGVELPKFYMERHWKSVVFLLIPVMTFGWLITSLFIWWMVPPLDWLESLVVAACVTATDPVLASSVVGKGKFAKRVPKHLRDLLSAESGCNDGMAFPFIYLAIYLIQDHLDAKEVTKHWIVYTILYECIFGALYGFMIGYIARHGIKYAEQHDLIDRESFLVFYFVLALFCAGSGSILGVDDLLVGFSAGVGFSNDGWFTQKTEESHVSNVIDLLLNLAYFVYFGTIIPWEQFNNADLGLSAWKLSIIAIFVILFRRIPIMLALKPFIPDIKTWREALFAGHFGPIGVGAIFVAMMARGELETENPVPLAEMPPPDVPHYVLITLVWPVVTFIVVASILVHGSSIAVFTLGKHINTLTITMSYTTANEEGPSWMNRLPRISSQSRSQARTMSDTDVDDLKMPEFPPGTLPPIGLPGQFLRRVKEDENASRQGSRASSRAGRHRKPKKWDDGIGPGGPISQSAIFPQRRSQSKRASAALHGEKSSPSPPGERPDESQVASPTDTARVTPTKETAPEKASSSGGPSAFPDETRNDVEVYDEGDHIIVENRDGDVLAVEPAFSQEDNARHAETLKSKLQLESAPHGWSYDALKKRIVNWREEELQKRKNKEKAARKHEPARAYQFGNTIIVEDVDGEVVKKYDLPPQQKPEGDFVSQGLKYMGMGGRGKVGEKSGAAAGPADQGESGGAFDGAFDGASKVTSRPSMRSWASGAIGRSTAGEASRKKSVAEEQDEEDDRHIRFTIGGVGQRMTKEGFINEMRKFDKNTRREIVDQSNASHVVKTLAKQDPIPGDAKSSAKTPGRSGKAIASAATTPAPAPSADSSKGQLLQPAAAEQIDSARASAQGGQQSSPSSRSPSPAAVPLGKTSSRELPETEVERKRRLAVLRTVGGADGDAEASEETPAERRRREAALGMKPSTSGAGGGADEDEDEDEDEEEPDSDDDDTPRVPPTRRGIRFADVPERG